MNKVLKIYKIAIVISLLFILLSVIQVSFSVIDIEIEIPIAIGICSTIGLVSFIIDRHDYIKQYK